MYILFTYDRPLPNMYQSFLVGFLDYSMQPSRIDVLSCIMPGIVIAIDTSISVALKLFKLRPLLLKQNNKNKKTIKW